MKHNHAHIKQVEYNSCSWPDKFTRPYGKLTIRPVSIHGKCRVYLGTRLSDERNRHGAVRNREFDCILSRLKRHICAKNTKRSFYGASWGVLCSKARTERHTLVIKMVLKIGGAMGEKNEGDERILPVINIVGGDLKHDDWGGHKVYDYTPITEFLDSVAEVEWTETRKGEYLVTAFGKTLVFWPKKGKWRAKGRSKVYWSLGVEQLVYKFLLKRDPPRADDEAELVREAEKHLGTLD